MGVTGIFSGDLRFTEENIEETMKFLLIEFEELIKMSPAWRTSLSKNED